MYNLHALVPISEAEAGSKTMTLALTSSDSHIIAPCTSQALGEQLPQCGWLRTTAGGRLPTDPAELIFPAFAPYHSREVYDSGGTWYVKFYLAPNRISGLPVFEDAYTFDQHCRGKTVAANTLSFPALGATPPTPVRKLCCTFGLKPVFIVTTTSINPGATTWPKFTLVA